MLRNAVCKFLRYFPSICFITTVALLYFPIPFLGWIVFTLFVSSLIAIKIKNILEKPTSLLNTINNLKQPENRLLTSEEIDQFKNSAKDNDLVKLAQYEKYVTDTCGITLLEMHEISEPITVQHKAEEPHFAKTYDKNALKTWIATKGVNVTEPLKRWYKLNDPNIEIYAGYPRWVQSFIEYVLNAIKKNPKTKKEIIAEERGLFYQKHLKTLFPAKKIDERDEKKSLSTPTFNMV